MTCHASLGSLKPVSARFPVRPISCSNPTRCAMARSSLRVVRAAGARARLRQRRAQPAVAADPRVRTRVAAAAHSRRRGRVVRGVAARRRRRGHVRRCPRDRRGVRPPPGRSSSRWPRGSSSTARRASATSRCIRRCTGSREGRPAVRPRRRPRRLGRCDRRRGGSARRPSGSRSSRGARRRWPARASARPVCRGRRCATAAQVTRGKPEPEGYLRAAQALGVVDAATSVVLEDAPAASRRAVPPG